MAGFSPGTTSVVSGEPFSLGETSHRRSEFLAPTTALQAASQQLRLTYFTPAVTEAVTAVALWTGATAAGATPTLIRIGIYLVNSADDGTSLVASTPNDTTLLASINTRYQKSFSATWNKVGGQRYAVGLLVVSGATMPHTVGFSQGGQQAVSDRVPRYAGLLAAQADLPSSFTAASLSASGLHTFYEFLR